jgi:hypothetical protein
MCKIDIYVVWSVKYVFDLLVMICPCRQRITLRLLFFLKFIWHWCATTYALTTEIATTYGRFFLKMLVMN